MTTALDSIAPPPRPRAAACVVLIVAAVFATFARLLSSDFTFWDDQGTIHSNALMNPPTLGTLRYYWTTPSQGLFVPVTYTIWAAIARVAYVGRPDDFGISLNPMPFHIVGVACHAATAGLAFLVIRRLFGGDARAALVGALLFALHPAQVESVGWVSGGKDLFCWLGAMGVVLLYVRRVQATQATGRPLWRSWEMPAAAALLGLAILSKPTAMVTPAALLAIDGLAMRRRWVRPALELLPLLAVSVAGMVVARIAQGVEQTPAVPLPQRPLVVGNTLAFYLAKLVWPASLSPDYGLPPDALLARPGARLLWVVPAALAIALVARHRRWPWAALGGALFAIGVAPISGVATFQMQRISTVTDHYLYFSMFGAGIVAAWAASRWRGRLATLAIAVALAALAAKSFAQTTAWRDAFALFEATIRENPRSTAARNNLVVCYLNRLRPEPAIAERYADEAFAIDPYEPTVLWNYGVAKGWVGDFEASSMAFERAWTLAIARDAPGRYRFELARAAGEPFKTVRRLDDSLKWARRQLEYQPDDGAARATVIWAERAIAATRPTTGPAATAAPAPGPASAPSR